MEFKDTSLVKKYALNPEMLADKHPNVVDLVEELQQAFNDLEARVDVLEEPEV